jgi:hypothetical protein
MLWVPDHHSRFTTCAHRAPCPVLRRCGKPSLSKIVLAHCAGHAGMQTDARLGQHMPHGCALHSCHTARSGSPRNPGLATSCVDRRATDAPDAAPLTGRLQELGAQHRTRILPGALTLALASRVPPRLSWSTTFKRGLTVREKV